MYGKIKDELQKELAEIKDNGLYKSERIIILNPWSKWEKKYKSSLWIKVKCRKRVTFFELTVIVER